MSHKKLFTNNLVAILLIAVTTLSITQAQAFGDYKPHEHPFEYIGSSYSQANGNAICRQHYGDKGGNSEKPEVKAYDGTVINGANHVWYHQDNGECIANK